MATTLTVNNFKASVGWDYEQTNSFGQNTTNIYSFAASSTFANGSGNGKVQVLYAAQLTIAAAATATLELTTAGALKDPLGNTVNMAKVKGVFLQHTTLTATGLLDVAGNWFIATVLTGTTPALHLYPGMFMILGGGPNTADLGYAVTASTADALTLHNNDAASVVVNVAVLGE